LTEDGPPGVGGRRFLPWWAAVFALALGTRLAYLLLVDEPIRYTDQYFYLFGGLRLAGDPHPLHLIFTSDEWRLWGGRWTIAPLYYLFVAAVLRATGSSLFALQAVQCLLGALTAVAVGALGREAGGARGAWAGAVYAVYWPAIEMTQRVLTENLHVPILIAALVLVARAARRGAAGEAAAGGAVLALSALARSVSSSFVPIAAWIVRRPPDARGRWKPSLALLAAAAAVILPWSARNLLGTGSLAPIESLWAYNILRDNAFQHLPKYQEEFFFQGKKPSEAARIAPRFLAREIASNPWGLVEKIEANFGKVARAEGLHMWLDVEREAPPWLLFASVAADDLVLFVAAPLFGVFALAGAPGGARRTIVLWTAYYVFMVAVVFHVETRYRSALVPVVLAGAAGGLAAAAWTPTRRRRALAGLAVGSLVALVNVTVYAAPAHRALAASRTMAAATRTLARGDAAQAQQLAATAVADDRGAARPWITWAAALAQAGRPAEAAEACRQALLVRPRNPVPTVLLPQLLRESGHAAEAEAALAEAHDVAAHTDNWLALEEAWTDLPAPRRDEVRVGDDDYGAVRGFFQARGTYRWTWRRAALRLQPSVPAPSYQVTLVMGSPAPSPFDAPVVTLRPIGGPPVRITLARASAPFTVTARPPAGSPVIVEIESPTWTALGESAEQGVVVERMTVAPARE
jgi:4-amino-4-deoxy-L-arabinose transferase-like glycosyltransferase